MRSLAALEVDDRHFFDLIAESKQEPTKGSLLSARASVFLAYQAYADAAPLVETLRPAPFGEQERKALLHAFEVPNSPLKEFRDQLLIKVDAATCPFCGISESGTIDHYLPRQVHPAYAVYSRNLVPCCAKCNIQKGTSIVDGETGARLFLHPYFDEIPAERFLNVLITMSATTIDLEFRVDQFAGMSAYVYRQLESHFRLLRLADRYRLMSLNSLRGKAKALRRWLGTDNNQDRVRNSLLEESDSLGQAFGINYWAAVLYGALALAENEDFCSGGFQVIETAADPVAD